MAIKGDRTNAGDIAIAVEIDVGSLQARVGEVGVMGCSLSGSGLREPSREDKSGASEEFEKVSGWRRIVGHSLIG